MTALRQRMIEDMRLRNFSPHTVEAYVRAVVGFAQHFGKSPEKLTGEHAREYLLYLIQERKAGVSLYNITRCGLQFLYRITLARDERFERLPCARERRRLPVVLSREELQRFFSVIRNVKHRAMFMTSYGAGLRVSELVGLRCDDIDSDRMLIRVRSGKGQKDRYAKLSPHLLSVLRDYYRRCKPGKVLFPGKERSLAMNRLVVNVIAREIATKAGIDKPVSSHTFRHTYATHMLDAGADLRTIQVLLGHRSIKSTTIYMHVSQAKIDAAPSPLDLMYPAPAPATA
jgi:integrase/recombinase XerD